MFTGLSKLTHKLIGGESDNFYKSIISCRISDTYSAIPRVGSTPITETNTKVNIYSLSESI
jgi:hypothetical protein